MKRLLMLVCLAGMLRPQPLYAQTSDIEIDRAKLVCGGTKFLTKSEFIQMAPLSQTITATLKKNKPPVPVDLRQTKIRYPFELGTTKGLASFVSAWECRKTRTEHILVLWYDCKEDLREDVPRALCSPTKEWQRYVAIDGTLLDRGFSFTDVRYDRLRKKLGYADEGSFISIN